MKCQREETNDGMWTCHRCQAIWTFMLADTGWLPLECCERPASSQTMDEVAADNFGLTVDDLDEDEDGLASGDNPPLE